MVRTRVKGNGKAASSPATEPNFYEMETCDVDAVMSYPAQDPAHDPADMGNEDSVASYNNNEDVLMSPEAEGSKLGPSFEDLMKVDIPHPSLLGMLLPSGIEVLPLTRSVSGEPPISPILSEKRHGYRMVDSTTSNDIICNGSDLIPMTTTPVSVDSDMEEEPHSGDCLFFEGLKFRYLDRLNVDTEEDPLFDSST